MMKEIVLISIGLSIFFQFFLADYIFQFYGDLASQYSKISKENSEHFCKSISGGSNVDTVVPNFLYIGNLCGASNPQSLSSRNINYVINTARECENYFPDKMIYLFLNLQDKPQEIISTWFEESREFINKARFQKSSVLVHSARGGSRSAAIVISYLMLENSWRFYQAYDALAKKRPMINPLSTFRRELVELESKIFGDIHEESKKLMTDKV